MHAVGSEYCSQIIQAKSTGLVKAQAINVCGIARWRDRHIGDVRFKSRNPKVIGIEAWSSFGCKVMILQCVVFQCKAIKFKGPCFIGRLSFAHGIKGFDGIPWYMLMVCNKTPFEVK